MEFDNSDQQWKIERPETQVVPVVPGQPDTDHEIPSIDIQKVIEEERKKWVEPKMPQAKFRQTEK